MNYRASTVVLWFATLGGPLAWATQFVAGLAITNAQCNSPTKPQMRWELPVHAWQITFAAAGLLVAVAAEVVSVRIFRRSRGAGLRFYDPVSRGDPTLEPVGRVQFMGLIGLTVNPIAMAIIVLSGIGGPLLQVCRQS